jgi:multiple antibiotic resistance protein
VSALQTIKFLVAMIIMMNPLGSLSIFMDLTSRYTNKQKRIVALKCGFAMISFMVISIWIGDQLLDLFSITIDSFRFAGGLILLLVGLSMLQSKESPFNHNESDEVDVKQRHSLAIVPLALPIIIGPGAISTLVLVANDYPDPTMKLWMSILCIFLATSMGLLLYFADAIADFVGAAVMKVITRIMGMLLMAIAVGMLAHGLRGLIPALNH